MSSVFTADRTQVSAPNQLNNKCVLTALCMLSTAPSVVAEIKSEMYSLGASVVLPLWDPLDCSQGSSVPGNSFSRQEHWSGLPFPPLGDLPDPGIKPQSPAWQTEYLPVSQPEEPVPSFGTFKKSNHSIFK